jgi:drug/metabolite transporter (DMT)-like permease
MKNQKQAYIYALSAVFLWSTVATAFKLALRHLHTTELLLIAAFTSMACLFAILWGQSNLHLLRNLTTKDLLWSSILGFLNPFLYYLALFKAYDLLPAQIAQPLNMIWGIVIVLLSIPILKQKIKPRSFLALFIAFFGVVILSTGGNITSLEVKNPLGIALALSCSVIWSFYWLMNARDTMDPILRLFLNFSFGFLFTLIFYLLTTPIRPFPTAGIAGAVYTGLFEMGITFFLWIKALKLTTTTDKVGILIYIAPFISLVFIHFILGETIALSSVAGLTLIVAGILVQQADKLKIK